MERRPVTVTTKASIGPGGDLVVSIETALTTTIRVPPGTGGAAWSVVDGAVMLTIPGQAPITIPAATSVPAPSYPIPMPPGIAAGAPVTLGAGPDALVLLLANNPNTPLACSVGVLLNGEPLAGPLAVSSWAGASGGQVFTILGNWGTATPVVELVGEGSGDAALWINAVTYNLAPLVTQQGAANQAHYWASQGETVTFGAPVAVVAPPPPPPSQTLSLIPAQIGTGGGSLLKTDTLPNLLAAVPAGATITLGAGHWAAAATAPNACTIQGAVGPTGANLTTLDCTGVAPAWGKAVIDILASGTVVRNLIVKGATNNSPGSGGTSGSYASGVRADAAGTAFTVGPNVEIYGCDIGIQSPGSPTLDAVYVHDCGMGDGFTHAVYVMNDGAPTQEFVCTGSTLSAGALSTHALKTRAPKSIVAGGTLSNTGTAGPNATGSLIDVSDGGAFTASSTTLIMNAASPANIQLLGFAMESDANSATGSACSLLTCAIEGLAGIIQNGGNAPAATLTVTGTTAVVLPTIEGFASQIGTISAAGLS
jgi:hypothetical protein